MSAFPGTWGGRHSLLGPPRPAATFALASGSFSCLRSFGCGPPLSAGLIAFCCPPHGDRHARLVWSVAVSARTAKEPKKQATVAVWLNQPSCRHLGAACSPCADTKLRHDVRETMLANSLAEAFHPQYQSPSRFKALLSTPSQARGQLASSPSWSAGREPRPLDNRLHEVSPCSVDRKKGRARRPSFKPAVGKQTSL